MRNLLLLFLLFIAIQSQAYEYEQYGAITRDLQTLMERADENETLRINIRMKEQYDTDQLMGFKSLLNREQLRSHVISELKLFSETNQKGIVAELTNYSRSSDVSNIKQYWIANIINCYATPGVVRQLASRNDVESIDIDEERVLIDPVIGNIIGGSNSGITREITYNVLKMNAPDVWALGFTGQGIVVAVLDTGVNYNHNDLNGNMWIHPSYPYHGWNFISNNNNPMDNHGHGTHCAGTVAGNGASGSQTGVAPNAKIMALKVLDDSGSGTESGVWDAIQFSVDNGAHVMSLSLGWRHIWSPDRATWRNVMNNALAAGLIASVAAGNEGSGAAPGNVRTPGDVPPPWLHPDQTLTGGISAVVSVGATDVNDNIASFSSQGPVTWQAINPFNDYPYNPGLGLIRPDVSAPGVDVKSLSHSNTAGYTSMSGTSMATPGVAGVMALLLSKNPNANPEKLAMALELTSVDLGLTGKDNVFGTGRVDAFAAINNLNYPGPVYSNHTIDDPNSNGQIEAGESILLSIEIFNGSDDPRTNIAVELSTNSTYVTITDNSGFYGDFAAWEFKTVSNGFAFDLSSATPGLEVIRFDISASDGVETWTSHFNITTFGPRLEFGNIIVSDPLGNNNGRLDPGETVDLIIAANNIGQLPVNNVLVSLGSLSEHIMINDNEFMISSIPAAGSVDAMFSISVSAAAPAGAQAIFSFEMVSGIYTDQKDQILYVGQIPALILNLDPNNSSAPAMGAAMSSLNVAYHLMNNMPAELDIYASVFVCLGIFPNNTVLSQAYGTQLAAYLNNGGQLYMEGGDTWYYDSPTPVHGMFNISASSDGGSDMATVAGKPGTFTQGMSFSYVGDNNWMDRISAVSPATLILENTSPVYGTGVAYNAGTYKSIGTSHEFGGLAEGVIPSTRMELMNQYLTFFGITGIALSPPSIMLDPLSVTVTLLPDESVSAMLNIVNEGEQSLSFNTLKQYITESKPAENGKDAIEYTEPAMSREDYVKALASRITKEHPVKPERKNIDYTNFRNALCAPTFSYGCSVGDGFTDFAIEQIQNLESGCEDNTGSIGWSTYYDLGPAILEAGQQYTFSMSTGYSNQYVNLWIDFNDDNILSADERILNNFNMAAANTLYPVNIMIPEDALPGLHRMRAMARWLSSFDDPCGSYTYGEAEDYYVMILSDFADWLTLEPSSGNIPGGNSAGMDLNFNSEGLEPGTYQAEITVLSNDPLAPAVVIPVTMHVVDNLVPEHLEINGQLNETGCFNASGTVTIEGASILNGVMADIRSGNSIAANNFQVEEGGMARLTANSSIALNEGVLITPGSDGFFIAEIAGFEPCTLLKSILASSENSHDSKTGQLVSLADFLQVFPNPTTGVFTLRMICDQRPHTAIAGVYNNMGQQIIDQQLSDEDTYEFDLRDEPDGLYFIRVVMGHKTQTLKLIKK